MFDRKDYPLHSRALPCLLADSYGRLRAPGSAAQIRGADRLEFRRRRDALFFSAAAGNHDDALITGLRGALAAETGDPNAHRLDDREVVAYWSGRIVSDATLLYERRAVGASPPQVVEALNKKKAKSVASKPPKEPKELPPDKQVRPGRKPAPETVDKPEPLPAKKPAPPPLVPVPELGGLVVVVKDANGNPVEGVDVNAGHWGAMLTDKDGIAEFGEVSAGADEVQAHKLGHAPARNDPEGPDVEPSVTVNQGTQTVVELVQHPLCANVSFFEGSKTRSEYYGFDHKTDIVQNAGADEYWLPTPDHGALTLPANRLTRDGARWVSVPVGKETEVEINFAFKGAECIPCISNSSFEVVPANVATVVTASVSSKQAKFKIKGKAEGEASLKVICDGKDIGWFHIWCKHEATLRVDVVNLVTKRAPADAFDVGVWSDAFNEIYRQAAIKIDMISLGNVDLSDNALLEAVENNGYPSSGGGRFLDKSGTPRPYDSKALVLGSLNLSAGVVLALRLSAPLARTGAYRIYRYIPAVGAAIGGTVLNIGSSPAFSFISDSAAARNSAAHEMGHCLGLRHPSDSSSGAQFATHNRSSRNNAVPAYAATNTEPATSAAAAKSNVMANDPTNLMGYWHDKPSRKPIRYHQWRACSRS